MKKILARPRILTALVFFCIALVLMRFESDTFWLMRAGKEIWHGNIPLTETWSFTSNGNYWPNHEWLFEALLYFLTVIGFAKFIFIVIVTALISSVALSLNLPNVSTYEHFKVKAQNSSFLLWIFLIVLTLPVYSIRPNLISLIFFSFLLYILRKEKYAYLPLVFLLWSNFHSGFLTGAILCIVALGLAVGKVYREKNAENVARLKQLVIFGLIALISTLLNPLGFKMWLYIITSVTKTDSEVNEFAPLWHTKLYTNGGSIVVLLALLASMAITLLFLKKNIKSLKTWEQQLSAIAVTVFLVLAILVVRFNIFYIMLALPYILLAWDKVLGKIHVPNFQYLVGLKREKSLVFIPIILLAVLGLFNSMRPAPEAIPSELKAKIASCNNTYNDYWGGGYLLWYYPEHKVFQDNRFDPYDDELKNLRLGEATSETILNKYNIDCAVVHKMSKNDVKYFKNNSWKQTYGNDTWYLFKR